MGSELGERSVAREHAAATPPEGGLGERLCGRRGKVRGSYCAMGTEAGAQVCHRSGVLATVIARNIDAQGADAEAAAPRTKAAAAPSAREAEDGCDAESEDG